MELQDLDKTEITEFKAPILYVDDEESNLRIFKTTFKRHYQVFTALSGAEGLEILAENEIHLIITDQKMPKMTGIEFLERVLPLYPDPIRIILTGFSDVEAIIKAINTGSVYRYITKPWNKDELKITIDKALETYTLQQENKQLIVNLREANEGLERKVVERTREIEEQKQQIEAQSAELTIINQKITDSIRYAQRIQQAILPEIQQIQEFLPNSFVLLRPRDIVSGDFYWFHESQDKIFLSAIDCTGHGVPGAFMSLIGSDLSNAIIKVRGISDPAQILQFLHEGVRNELRQDINSNQDGMDIAMCVIDKKMAYMEFAGAKNPLVSIQGNSANPTVTITKGDKQPIGGGEIDEKRSFTKHRIEAQADTTHYIFSDGYQDQFGGTQDRKLLRKGFLDKLQQTYALPINEQKDFLNAFLVEWMGDANKQIDDVLVIGFQLRN